MKRMIRQRRLNLGLFGFLTLVGVMVIACLMMSSGKVVEAGGGGGDVDYDNAPKLPLYYLVNHVKWDAFIAYTKFDQDDLFTTDLEEKGKAEGMGFEFQRVAAYILKDQLPGTVPLYRLYHSHNSHGSMDHFMTIDLEEKGKAQAIGYELDGVLGYVATKQLPVSRQRSNSAAISREFLVS